MYRISKRFSFSASHMLNFLDKKHPCARMHGHNYILIIHLQSETLNEYGFVRDYKDLDRVRDYVESVLDHQNLNEIIPYYPTSENIARFIYEYFKSNIPELYAVEVRETPQTSCIYEP